MNESSRILHTFMNECPPPLHPDTARTRRKTITLTNSERPNAKSAKANAHPRVNAYKLWAFTLAVHLSSTHRSEKRSFYSLVKFSTILRTRLWIVRKRGLKNLKYVRRTFPIICPNYASRMASCSGKPKHGSKLEDIRGF